MKSIFILLLAVFPFIQTTAQKIFTVASSVLTGISLPENTKRDKRFLIESAAKTQLKNEADKYNASLTYIEVFRIEMPLVEDSIKHRIKIAGWQLYASVTSNYYWATNQGRVILVYLSANRKNADLYFCEAISNNNSPLIVNNIPANNTVNNNQNSWNSNAASSSSITCGNLIFTVPAGWKMEADGENYTLMLPPRYNDPQRWVNIAVFKGNVSSGSIDTDFNNAWQKFLGKYTKYQEPFLIKEKSIKGYDIVRGGTNIRKGNDMPLYAHLWVAKVKDKIETVIVFANNSNDFDITVNTAIKPFWAKLQFKNLPEAATQNYTLKGNGIQGIYTGLQSGMRMNGGIAKNISFLIIYNDGKLKSANKLPENGFNNFDRDVDREINAGNWGDYDFKKGIVVFDKNSQPRTLGFTYQPPKVIYNEYAYTKIPPVDGLSLAGIYTADNSPAAIAAFGHEPTISFYKDGRFEDNTALYYVKSYDAMFKNPGWGKYTITNFTIDLLYDDGRGGASFPLVTWNAATNSSIQIGEQILLKK
ncbi:MAG: hypothetical protein H7Y86_06740 [Rhizobacter sp.]|nr:hypothetical protein [Ferruginibacter sp.]